MIQYRYGKDETNALIDICLIKSREAVRGRKFTCPGCGHPLYARLGDRVAHHFAHNSDAVCRFETYLHKTATQVFFHEYRNCVSAGIPYFVEYNQPRLCVRYFAKYGDSCRCDQRDTRDLTRYFPNVEWCASSEGFISDVMLTNARGEENLLVEIAVTHKCSPEKRASGLRIIEISIEDEADIELLKGRLLSDKEQRVEFINFKIKTHKADYCSPGECPNRLGPLRLFKWLVIKKDGDCLIREVTRQQFERYLAQEGDSVIYYKHYEHFGRDCNPFEDHPSRREMIRDAYRARWDDPDANVRIRSCHLCQHQEESAFGRIDCALHGRDLFDRQALQCPDFHIDSSLHEWNS